MKLFFTFIFFIHSLFYFSQKGLVKPQAMVVSARIEASTIGKNILEKGGNAFDAMVATEFALAVCYPYAGSLGGGGFMVYRLHDGDVGSLDYREKAPSEATSTMYLNKKGEIIPNKSINGGLAIGVPGTVAGMAEAHKKFGQLSWAEVVQPAIDLAMKGYKVTDNQEKRIYKKMEIFRQVNSKPILYDNNWKSGDTIKNPALAKTLSIIRDKGKDGFYKGDVARIITETIQGNGGIITGKDLKKYAAKWRTPISFNFKDSLRIISMPPPSSGGITLQQIMKMIEPYPLVQYGHNNTKYIQVLVEAERRAYADRNYYLGDPDFIKMPIETLTNTRYLTDRMKNIDFSQATQSSDVGVGNVAIYESNETTHYSIIDQKGNAVSVTTTLNGGFGSGLYDQELGFFYNNEMDDFSIKPGKANSYGLVQGVANKIEPEKRMLSSMTPTIVEKDNQLYMVVGTPGGSTIITSVLQTILNVTEFNMGMQQAVDAARFHHQWLPDEVLFEPNGFNKEVLTELEQKKYVLKLGESIVVGKVNAILVQEDGSLEAGADRRGDEAAAGF